MTTTLAIIMDPIESIKSYKDSSFAMLLASQEKKWQNVYFKATNLFIEDGKAFGYGQSIIVTDNTTDYFLLDEQKKYHLGDFSTILMRKDPPFDMNYIYTTYILDLAKKAGAFIANDPQSLRNYNEKITISLFPECAPTCLITGSSPEIKAFITQHKDVILKPLDGMGGQSIFRVTEKDANLSVILELMLKDPNTKIMAQTFIPDITNGDKRILIIDGKPAPYCLARIPTEGETRGNIAAGGIGVVQELSERDYFICNQLAPFLQENNIIFAGIDVIGDYLTEINITSPTCIREIDNEKGTTIAFDLINAIEEKIQH
jgi:glutathione synthase